ncbi:hypothetical protein BHM03_00005457, partial [Ensete ventricosum]
IGGVQERTERKQQEEAIDGIDRALLDRGGSQKQQQRQLLEGRFGEKKCDSRRVGSSDTISRFGRSLTVKSDRFVSARSWRWAGDMLFTIVVVPCDSLHG